MTLGAMLDAGLDQASLEEVLRRLDLPGFRLETSRVTKEHLAGVEEDFALRGNSRPGAIRSL